MANDDVQNTTKSNANSTKKGGLLWKCRQFPIHSGTNSPCVFTDKQHLTANILQSVITVFFNKGCTSEVSNVRPISLTCALCKIMEKIIVKHMFN